MFDIGWSEMAIIMLLALIIIGPKDLPRVARTVGQWVRKGRMLAREFQTSLEDMAKEAELDDVKREIEKVGTTDLKKSVENAIDPGGDLKKAFDTSQGTTGEETVGKALNGSAPSKPSSAKTSAPAKSDVSQKTETSAQPSAPAPAASQSKEPPASSAKAKRTTAARKPAASKKPAGTVKKTAAKKPSAPRKRAAKPASSAKSDTAMAAKSS